MAIRTREEINTALAAFIGDNTSDEAISLLEDVTDTMADLSAAAGEDWKTKYDELDKSWRERYKQRFTEGPAVPPLTVDGPAEPAPVKRDYKDLFKEE